MTNQLIHINCDLGEGNPSLDEQLMPLIDMASIACGGHAGNKDSMTRCVTQACQHGVLIGAHPSYPDRANFGRIRPQHIDPHLLTQQLSEQLYNLKKIADSTKVSISYVKPHGALYHDSLLLPKVLKALLSALDQVLPTAALVLQAKTTPLTDPIEPLLAEKELILEAFADRRYLADGSLMPRANPHAVLSTPEAIYQQAKFFFEKNAILADDGSALTLPAKTLCVHGDTPSALEALARIREDKKQNELNQKDMHFKSYSDLK